jgi:hypothetical protein
MVFASTVFWLQWMDLVVPQFEFDYSLQIAMFTICSDGGVRRIYLFLTYQYGLRPKRHQYRRLEAIPRGQRLLYNAALEERCQAWSKSHKSVTHFEQTKSLTTIRADDPQGYGALPVNLSRWSLSIARRFGGIAVEDLKVKNMAASAKGTIESPGKNVRQKASLNREILDTSPGMMISMLRYKAARAGGWFAVIDARNTSQDCSECGRTVLKDLSVRILKMRALSDGGPPRRQRGAERPETGRSRSVERLCTTDQRPRFRPSLRKPRGRRSPPNSGEDFKLRHHHA